MLSPASGWQHTNWMSPNVDAVLDGMVTPVWQPASGEASGDEGLDDYLVPLLHRTLRRRGLSDSSIHWTFAAQALERRPRAEAMWRGVGAAGAELAHAELPEWAGHGEIGRGRGWARGQFSVGQPRSSPSAPKGAPRAHRPARKT
ncbi:hypothetical protein K438DRAFT_1055062 [Mycena galopus ATCC 62051]|nr:hypothetical protein K438DRAFT_1055062 [Mycena galopus ATCC 62051]